MRKVSDSQKQKRGTVEKSRQRKPVVSGLKGYPQPDIELSEQQAKVYKRLCDHLRDVDAIFDADTYLLTQTAVNICAGAEAMQKLTEKGTIQEFKNGTRNVSPEYSIFEKCCTLFMRQSKLLGLDPSSRLTMEYFLNEGDHDTDPMEGLIG